MDVTAITSRDDFLLELGQALGGQAAVRPVDSLDEALQSMAGGKRGQVLVIDARAVADVRAAVDAAQAQVPRAAVLVFAEGPAEQELGAALKGPKVFAVLSTSIEPRKTAAVFEGAMAEALADKAPPTPAPLLRRQGSSPSEPSAPGARRSSSDEAHAGRPRVLLIGAAAAAARGRGGFWYFMHGNGGPARQARRAAGRRDHARRRRTGRATPVAANPASNLLIEGKVDELLEKARLAMHERRYTDPAGDNALLYYRSAVAADSRQRRGGRWSAARRGRTGRTLRGSPRCRPAR